MPLAAALLAAALSGSAQAGEDFPYTTRYVETSFGQMACWDVGEGEQTIILVHGLPTSKEIWVDVIPHLAEDRRVVALDLNNFGDSAYTDHRLTHPERAQGVDELRAALGIDTFVLVAHDLGSSVAVDYMDRYAHRVDSLVLMSSPVYPDFDEPDTVDLVRKASIGIPLLNLLPRTLFKSTVKKGLVNDEQLTREQVAAYARFYRGPRGKRALYANLWWGTPDVSFADYPDIMARIAVPTLVLHGRQDPFILLEHAERMDQDIPESRLVVFDGGGHFLPLDIPEQVGTTIDAFVEGGW